MSIKHRKLFLLEERGYDYSCQYGIFDTMQKAVNELNRFYYEKGTKLDVIIYEQDRFYQDQWDHPPTKLDFDKLIKPETLVKREQYLQSEHDEYVRLFGNKQASINDISNLIGSSVALSAGIMVLATVDHIVQEQKITDAMNTLFV